MYRRAASWWSTGLTIGLVGTGYRTIPQEHEAVQARQTKVKDMLQQERCRFQHVPSREVCVLQRTLHVR